MKKPSRYMPKYKETPNSFIGWLFLAILLALVVWLIWSAPVLLLIAPVLAVIEFINRNDRKKHFSLLLASRENDSICTFSRYFECRKIDTWVIRAVYEQLQNYMNSEKVNFSIRPSDDVFTDLLIDDEDFEYDLVEEIAERTGRSLENIESNSYYGKANIVENLVYFFNEQPKANAT